MGVWILMYYMVSLNYVNSWLKHKSIYKCVIFCGSVGSLHEMSGVSYDEMVLFDDEWKNRSEVEKLGNWHLINRTDLF